MKIRRITGGMAATAALALVLTACANTPSEDSTTTDGTDTETSEETTEATDGTTEAESTGGGTITVAETNQFFSFNPNTANGNTDINSKVIGYPTRANFNYINSDLEIVKDESFGTYEVTSEDPWTVTYTVNEGVNWSDGTPIDAGDLLLAWAIYSGHFNGPGADAESPDDDVLYFDYAGDTSTLGLTAMPEIGEDGRSITLVYSEPAADWEISFAVDAPAHVVAKNGGLADENALIELIQTAEPGVENAELRAVADFWNTGYDSTTLPSDPELYLASGPFIVSAVEENQSVTLVRNEAYTGDLKAGVDEIIVTTIPDATAAVQALRNGEVDVISPQSSADTLAALEAVEGVTVHTGAQLSYDHIDLTFNNGGPFDPATYGDDVEKAKLVREAFLLSIPRQAIVDAVVIPQKPDGQVLNSIMFVESQSAYADAVAANGSDAYPLEGDIEAAKAKLAEAGVTSPTVRILYNNNNPNRTNAYTLIAAKAAEAGFVIEDNGSAEWGSKLGDGTYDASIFGWISPGVGVGSLGQIYTTDAIAGGSNFNGYSNTQVDALAETLAVTTDVAEQEKIQIEADGYLFADAYGLPFFQSPGVDAVADHVTGIDKFNPNQAGVFWNVWEWGVTDAS